MWVSVGVGEGMSTLHFFQMISLGFLSRFEEEGEGEGEAEREEEGERNEEEEEEEEGEEEGV